MIKAKQILKDKFWIIEDNGERLGTLSAEDEKYVFSTKSGVKFYNTTKQLERNIGKIQFDNDKIQVSAPDTTNDVYGYPTRCLPYNPMYDVKRKLPLFTKSDKSKSVYCAGYYLVRFNVEWLKSYCPKLITIERNEYIGPFKTDIEMRQELSRVNKRTD